MSDFSAYLSSRSTQKRIEILRDLVAIKNFSKLNPWIIFDLLSLPLQEEEKILLLELLCLNDRFLFEVLIVKGLAVWEQNLTATAIRFWKLHSEKLLWYRILSFAIKKNLPQRVRYTLLDSLDVYGGRELALIYAEQEDIALMSDAYLALLLKCCLQFSISSKKMHKLVKEILAKEDAEKRKESYPYLLLYAKIFMAKMPSVKAKSFFWQDYLKMLDSLDWRAKKQSLLQRTKMSKDDLAQEILALKKKSSDEIKDFLQGIPIEKIIEAVDLKKNDFILPYLSKPLPLVLDLSNVFMYGFSEISADLKFLLPAICDDAKRYIENKYMLASDADLEEFSRSKNAEDYERDSFFSCVFRKQVINSINTEDYDSFWNLLLQNFLSPNIDNLPVLAAKARKVGGVFLLCYIKILGSFKGKDEASLKLLDFVRSEDEIELQAVCEAFAGIGTSRAAQELLFMITRNNISAPLVLNICYFLRDCDLKALQNELRSTIADIKTTKRFSNLQSEIIEELSALTEINTLPLVKKGISAAELDLKLAEKIEHYSMLSSEVRMAFRSAEFFTQELETNDLSKMDFSPVIDMQYKALELLFREQFERRCVDSVGEGKLQRLLDVIGYARPVPAAMENFEQFIANLVFVREIPYFSKYKLRKMLRGICLFKKGQRFTLDGLKAFALFFLVFARKECPYGLANAFFLPFSDLESLTKFCKNLHIFQDYRNRAAHEGFRPENREAIGDLWQISGSIVSNVLCLKGH